MLARQISPITPQGHSNGSNNATVTMLYYETTDAISILAARVSGFLLGA